MQLLAARTPDMRFTQRSVGGGRDLAALRAPDTPVFVIECNVRASRSMPFCSKVLGFDLIEIATRAMVGLPVARVAPATAATVSHVGVKVPQFSFNRLPGFDPLLGVEMASTGEVACIGGTVHDAFLKALVASGVKLPRPGDGVLLHCDLRAASAAVAADGELGADNDSAARSDTDASDEGSDVQSGGGDDAGRQLAGDGGATNLAGSGATGGAASASASNAAVLRNGEASDAYAALIEMALALSAARFKLYTCDAATTTALFVAGVDARVAVQDGVQLVRSKSVSLVISLAGLRHDPQSALTRALRQAAVQTNTALVTSDQVGIVLCTALGGSEPTRVSIDSLQDIVRRGRSPAQAYTPPALSKLNEPARRGDHRPSLADLYDAATVKSNNERACMY
jgi:hypothetical protein